MCEMECTSNVFSRAISSTEQILLQDFLNIVLEYVENGSLADTVKKFGSLPESLIAVYIEQACSPFLPDRA